MNYAESPKPPLYSRGRTWSLLALSLAMLMATIDGSIVNVALPAVKSALDFSNETILWVVEAYLLTLGGCLILSGRLGDVFGRRRVFISGVAVFTISSLGCGMGHSQTLLIASRALQGLGAAIMSVLSATIVMDLFKDVAERATALGLITLTALAGSSIGMLLGGFLTDALGWHWIFLINVPIGASICCASLIFLPRDSINRPRIELDISGALTLTVALTVAIYAIMNANSVGWKSMRTVGEFVASIIVLSTFVVIQTRSPSPLLPAHILRAHSLILSSIVSALCAASGAGWFYVYARYLELSLNLTPLSIGLAYLPANLAIAAMSIRVPRLLVLRFGNRATLITALLIMASGHILLGVTTERAFTFVRTIPGMIVLGLGSGILGPPLTLLSIANVASKDLGSAIGIFRTATLIGSALGISLLSSIAAARTDHLLANHLLAPRALSEGYGIILYLDSFLLVASATVSLLFARRTQMSETTTQRAA